MKFIERLFGKKQEKEESHSTVFEFRELTDIVKKEITTQEDSLKPVVKEKYDTVKQALKELENLKKELLAAEPIENVSKRGEKLGDSNRDNVANNLKNIISKLNVPGNSSPVVASEFYMDAKSTLKTVLDNTSKSLIYIKALYPQEHQKINQGLADLEDSLDELQYSIMKGNERVNRLQRILAAIEDIRRIEEETEQSIRRLTELDSRYKDAKEKSSENETIMLELVNSTEFERAKQLESEIEKIAAKIADTQSEARRLFTPLSKAISRMEKQDENDRCVLSPQNRETLRSIKNDPAAAIELDLNPFFLELTSRIESGELGLKDQMCDKALKQIQVLSGENVISSLAQQRREELTAREELIAQLNSLSIYQEREKIEREIEAEQSHLSSANNEMDSERRHLDSREEEMERTKSALLADIRDVFGSGSKIVFDTSLESI